jgi:hypothetical protein
VLVAAGDKTSELRSEQWMWVHVTKQVVKQSKTDKDRNDQYLFEIGSQ